MFALEIDFNDGISAPETLLIRRSSVRLGASEHADVVVDCGVKNVPDLLLSRGVGHEFSCRMAEEPDYLLAKPTFLEGSYFGEASLSWGEISLHIVALDYDFMIGTTDTVPFRGIDAIRRAERSKALKYPAVKVCSGQPFVVSFIEGTEMLIGKSRACALRLDAPDIMPEHLRVNFDGQDLWMEPVGADSIVELNGSPVATKTKWAPNQKIQLGSRTILASIFAEADVAGVEEIYSDAQEEDLGKYPCLVSNSDPVKPKHFIIPLDKVVAIGRDPTSDIWIGESHISRRHAELSLTDRGEVILKDVSSNGVYIDGRRIQRSEPLKLSANTDIDFSQGVVIKLLFNSVDSEEGEQSKLPLEQTVAESWQISDGRMSQTTPVVTISEHEENSQEMSLGSESEVDALGSSGNQEEERISLTQKSEGADEDYGQYEDEAGGPVQNQRKSGPVFIGIIVFVSLLMVGLAILLFSS